MKLSKQYREPAKAALKHANNQNLELAFQLLNGLIQQDVIESSYTASKMHDLYILQRLRTLIIRRMRSEEFTEYMYDWMNKYTND